MTGGTVVGGTVAGGAVVGGTVVGGTVVGGMVCVVTGDVLEIVGSPVVCVVDPGDVTPGVGLETQPLSSRPANITAVSGRERLFA